VSDDFNFSWSFSLPQAPQPKAPAHAATLWAFDDCLEQPLPEGNVLLCSRRSGRRTVVTAEVLTALRHCRVFRGFDGHCRHLGGVLPELRGQDEEIKRILHLLRGAGLLVSADQLMDQWWRPAATSVPAPTQAQAVEAIACITTCDRPQPLQRLLAELPPSAGTPAIRYLVIDDSRRPENRRRNQELVAACAATGRCAIRYLGPAEQQGFVEGLVDRLPQAERAIRFLLEAVPDTGIVSHGRARNLALLLSLGRPLLFLDDDILPRAFAPPGLSAGPRISSSPRQAVFFPDNEAWAGYAEPDGLDPLRRHLEFLGLDLGQALPKVTQRPEAEQLLADLGSTELRGLGPDSPILFTACGSYGDPGIANNQWLYNLEGDSLERLRGSEAIYRRCLVERNLWLGRAGYQFVPNIALLSQLTGIDNRALLPPYFPLFRNEDFLFGFMAQLLRPKALMLDLPWAIAHLPDPPRRWEDKAVDSPAYSGLLKFTAEALYGLRVGWGSDSPETRLAAAAAQLQDLAAMPEAELRRWFTDHALQTRVNRINHWHALLAQQPQAPDYWRQDLLRGIQVNQDSLLDAGGYLLKDLPEHIPAERAAGYIASLWRNYAEALRLWPEIRAAAQGLGIP
jgi:hypothetical protein